MTDSTTISLQRERQQADDAFQKALEHHYGKDAGDMRYDPTALNSACFTLRAAYITASAAFDNGRTDLYRQG